MKIDGHIHVLKVALLGCVLELSVVPVEIMIQMLLSNPFSSHTQQLCDFVALIPVHDIDAIGFPFTQVVRQIVSDARPQQRGYATHWRHMILVDIVQDFVVQ